MDYELLIAALFAGAFLTAVGGWVRETRRPFTRVDQLQREYDELAAKFRGIDSEDRDAPEWGTRERVLWHARRRDFHAQKVVEALDATKE